MEPAGASKYFLDTSVARPMIHGTSHYKRHLAEQMNGRRYVSPFVGMEFRRSLIGSLINFYFILNLPTIKNIGEAMAFTANSYKTSELKAVLVFASQLFASRRIDFDDPAGKGRALNAVADIIIRVNALFETMFLNNGIDSTRCGRAEVALKAKPETASSDFEQFMGSFDDTEGCKSQCSVERFLLQHHRAAVEEYVACAKGLRKSDSTDGFRKIAANLQRILAKGADACSCRRCERIGDAIIALDAPREMQLEHLDKSFDQLCPPINQPHRRHIAETQVVKPR